MERNCLRQLCVTVVMSVAVDHLFFANRRLKASPKYFAFLLHHPTGKDYQAILVGD